MPYEWNKSRTKGWRVRALHYHDGKRVATSWTGCEREGHKPDHLRIWLQNRESQVVYGTLDQHDPTVTYGQLIAAWRDAGQLATYAPSEQKGRDAILRWWEREFGANRYHSTPVSFVQDGLRRHLSSPATRNRYRSAMSAVIKWAMREGRASKNVFEGLKEREHPRVGEAYRDDELAALFNALDAHDDKRLLCAAALSLTTGERRNALWQLRLQDVAGGWVRLSHDTKRDQHRSVPLQAWVEELLREHVIAPSMPPYAPLFATQRWGGVTWPQPKWNAVVDAAGLPRSKSFHRLRHTFVTRTLGEGVSVQWVARFTGHTTAWLLDRYTHLTDDAMERAFGREQDTRGEAERLRDATRDPRS